MSTPETQMAVTCKCGAEQAFGVSATGAPLEAARMFLALGTMQCSQCGTKLRLRDCHDTLRVT